MIAPREAVYAATKHSTFRSHTVFAMNSARPVLALRHYIPTHTDFRDLMRLPLGIMTASGLSGWAPSSDKTRWCWESQRPGPCGSQQSSGCALAAAKPYLGGRP